MFVCVRVQQKKVYVICSINFITPDDYADFSVFGNRVPRSNARSDISVYSDFSAWNDFHCFREKAIEFRRITI